MATARFTRSPALALLVSLSLLAACVGDVKHRVPGAHEFVSPVLAGDHWRTSDGQDLPLRRWTSSDPSNPDAVILALHGFNDYSNAFDAPARWLAEQGLTVYAYDQRGFGAAPGRGFWPGRQLLVDDARTIVRLIKKRHPNTPLYIMGSSMGGAVALAAADAGALPEVDGMILAAPAVWGWSSLNPLYALALRLTTGIAPGWRVTGSSLNIWPSDNIEMLRALSKDPLMIRETRTDTVYGLVELMDRGYQAAQRVNVPTLVLYGEKDEIIPRKPVEDIIETLNKSLAPTAETRIYANGYHMLLRDLQADVVLADIVAWMKSDKGASSAR